MGRGWISIGLGIVLVAGACGNGDDAVVLTDPSSTPTTSASSTTTSTTTAATTSTVAPSTTTAVTVDDAERVGSLAKLEEQIDAVYAELADIAHPRDEVPFPDVTNADPAVALEEMIEFHMWVMTHNPWSDWVQLYAADGSQYAVSRRNLTEAYGSTTALYVFGSKPFEFHKATEVALSSVALDANDRGLLVEGAVAFRFTSSVGDFHAEFTDTGEVIDSITGWDDSPAIAVLIPTDAGWRVLYTDFDR